MSILGFFHVIIPDLGRVDCRYLFAKWTKRACSDSPSSVKLIDACLHIILHARTLRNPRFDFPYPHTLLHNSRNSESIPIPQFVVPPSNSVATACLKQLQHKNYISCVLITFKPQFRAKCHYCIIKHGRQVDTSLSEHCMMWLAQVLPAANTCI